VPRRDGKVAKFTSPDVTGRRQRFAFGPKLSRLPGQARLPGRHGSRTSGRIVSALSAIVLAFAHKQTCLHGQADLLIGASRPAFRGKQTCLHGQADLLIGTCRPAYVGKQTCLAVPLEADFPLQKQQCNCEEGPIAPGLGDESIRSKYSFHTTSCGCSPARGEWCPR